MYDLDKKLLSTVFSDSSSIQMVYDTTFAGSSRPSEVIYDQGSTSFAYDTTTGNLSSVVSTDSVAISYSYDGSLTTQQAWSGPVTGTIDYTYDNDFRVTSQSINGSNTVGFTYDDDGLLVGAGALSMTYDSQNTLLNNTAIDSMSSSYSYNSFGELTGKTTAYNNADLYDRSFSRDSLGRITSIDEIVEGDSTLYEYAYNDIGYLVEEKINGVVTAEYRYDANGNRTAYMTPTDTITATYDEQDRMLTHGNASYSYGPRGDLQQKIAGTDTTTYNYDNVGNLRSVVLPDGIVIEYIIDGQDRRVAKKVNGQITKSWLYAGGLMPVAELDATGSVAKRYGAGYIVKNDTTYRMIRDHLGSVRMVVNSQTGQVVQRIDYDAWGDITHLQNENKFTDIGYAGGLYDQDTGLTRFGARDYDPQTGRWTAKDPILFEGGTSNLYEYALNDPVNVIDPDGLQSTVISDRFEGLREQAKKSPWAASGAFYGAASSITGAEHIATMEGRACATPQDEARAKEIFAEGALTIAGSGAIGTRFFRKHIFSWGKTREGGNVFTLFGRIQYVGERISRFGQKYGYKRSINYRKSSNDKWKKLKTF